LQICCAVAPNFAYPILAPTSHDLCPACQPTHTIAGLGCVCLLFC
jgi:hypothetical protein